MKDKDELKRSLLDPGADIVDTLIHVLTENELLDNLPIAGMLFKTGKAYKSISDFLFLKKVLGFIETVNEKTTERERTEFTENLRKNEAEWDKLYSTIFLRLDKFDDVSKPGLFAKIFACFITNKIRYDDYTGLGAALNLASLEELKTFSNSYWKERECFFPYFSTLHGSHYESLLTARLVNLSLKRKDDHYQESNTYTSYDLEFKATELGSLYAYIAEDFEDHFSSIGDQGEAHLSTNSEHYSFRHPSSK